MKSTHLIIEEDKLLYATSVPDYLTNRYFNFVFFFLKIKNILFSMLSYE